MIYNYTSKRQNSESGVLLIELLIVLMIMGILITGAVKAWDVSIQQAKFNQTAKEINELCYAIAGNPDLYAEGKRTDFGYIGDMGKVPDTLADLVRAPDNSTNWRGPYIKNKFSENPNDYIQDAWGNFYIDNHKLYNRH
jgi:type II secretory pathway pseudopilin PulG